LTRGGTLFQYRSAHNINQYATYAQDSITLGNFLLNVGIRGDTYYGLTSDTGVSPRIGLAYHVKRTNTILRFAYSRTFETPFNENLLLSSATGLNGGLAANVFDAASAPPLRPGRRNQFNTGFQQAIGKYLLIDADYFWKYTDNAYDFSTLLNTTITFPIAWNKSKLDGVTGRVSTTNLRGFQAYWTFGHTRSRYFPDQTGGIISQGDVPTSVFRIDHDQAFQSTMMARYQRPKSAEWISFSWRYDSGLVAGIADVADALTLTAAQQVAIGFSCDGVAATYASPISACEGTGRSRLLRLPQAGQAQDDHNPGRIQPRHLFNIGVGSDNLFHAESQKRLVARLEMTNLTNKTALYNFLSTFSGTHFVQPRSLIATVGFHF
jgi:outer membrane receptor for Fe3+-dicitrate